MRGPTTLLFQPTRCWPLFLIVGLASCQRPPTQNPIQTAVEMAKAGDARVCADADVQKIASVLVTRELPVVPRTRWAKFLFEKKGAPNFDAVSMVGLDTNINEVECSGTW